MLSWIYWLAELSMWEMNAIEQEKESLFITEHYYYYYYEMFPGQASKRLRCSRLPDEKVPVHSIEDSNTGTSEQFWQVGEKIYNTIIR